MSSAVFSIAKRELNSFFDSLMAYIMLIAFLGFSGFFTWIYGSNIFFRKEADLDVFFGIAKWTLFFFIPAITMKMLAEERKTGTIELLLTKAVSYWEVILGKFFACLALVTIALLLTLPYYISIAKLGNIDHGVVWSGYLGLLLLSAAYIALGLFASSITNNQIVAFLLALFIGIFFQFLFDAIATDITGITGTFISSLSMGRHFDSISKGVLDTKDLIYFISLTGFGLLLAELFVSQRIKSRL
ncbi:MAG: ABC transporter permease subunit [Saprospiraceae bacterium]|jgi:ABC-2 type transport system permease protein|nr:ABC transporter permease subunit [Saprospiraceae bacterium]MBK7794991.1 ABC transporter permease subunit [Saprospiraceae bacterium]MBK8153454.1 ABC transporter permease subunit [Saprospiraceae bacterium]MBL0262121.1 ABC transporter permease subunit [Saprospiraceae bacterium]